MNPDDEICYCYHVSLRKLVNYAKREQPGRPSQMSQCLNAGTGCGWCIPFLIKIAQNPGSYAAAELTRDEYAAARANYIRTQQPRNSFSADAESDDTG